MSISLDQFCSAMDPSRNGLNDSISNTQRLIDKSNQDIQNKINQTNEQTRMTLNNLNNQVKAQVDKTNQQAAKDWSKESVTAGIQKWEEFNVDSFMVVADGLTPAIGKVADKAGEVIGKVGGSLLDSLGISTNMLIGMACVAAFIVLK